MAERIFQVFRGTTESSRLVDFTVDVSEGMVVLDALHEIQATQAPDLAVRWNCKAGKCGSCSAEVNGVPQLTCMTRIDQLPVGSPITVTPMKAFPLIKDLVTDVAWNYEVSRRIPAFKPREPDFEDGTWRMYPYEVERAQEFKKCIECFLCQDVCHVLRSHDKHDEFLGPAYLTKVGAWEMHPLDVEDRTAHLMDQGILFCNITKCCTEVCPEKITITDNAIIPLKERVMDSYYDPVVRLIRLFRRG